ncbi:MAG: RHS repeat-associated core domain-containing protein [Sphingobacteriales bacterium]|nr:MAG: RHS repeat-associated core domain-containing protein [Sphingobacteriales bacterium]
MAVKTGKKTGMATGRKSTAALTITWLYTATGRKLQKRTCESGTAQMPPPPATPPIDKHRFFSARMDSVGSARLPGTDTLTEGEYYRNISERIQFIKRLTPPAFTNPAESMPPPEEPPTNCDKRDYIGAVEYDNNIAEAYYHEEGRVNLLPGMNLRHEYSLRDHLGNTRIAFTDDNNDGTAEILQQTNYYPFGLPIEELSTTFDGVGNNYQYNGKELNEDFGLHWMDYGARWYDPQINRWGQIDPLVEKYVHISPYAYVANNPMLFVDPNGKENMIYLLFLPSAGIDTDLRHEIRMQMQAILDNFLGEGIVKVMDFTGTGSNIINGCYLDPSDSFVAFGSVKELKSIAHDCFYSCKIADQFINEFTGSEGNNPEWSENTGFATGRFVGIDAAELLKGNTAVARGEIGAHLGVHGLGHNAGMGDRDSKAPYSVGNYQGLNEKGIMASGNARSRLINDEKVAASEFVSPQNNVKESGKFKEKFSGKAPSDNYKKNQDRGKMRCPKF